MARKTKHHNITDLVQYYISRYYQLLEREINAHTHAVKLLIANNTDSEYREELKGRYEAWSTEETAEYFKTGIDILTQVYSKEQSDLAIATEKEVFRNKFLNK